MTSPICLDCAHLDRAEYNGFGLTTCDVMLLEHKSDPVRGERVIGYRTSCATQRADEKLCGPRGRLFLAYEAPKSLWQRLKDSRFFLR